jgi:hypothetical protein
VIAAPMRICTGKPNCLNRVQAGVCAECAKQPRFSVKALYHSARWYAVKAEVRAEQPLCDECEQEGRVVAWTDLDHTIPHGGDLRLFWDRNNLRGKCAMHHSRKTRRGA